MRTRLAECVFASTPQNLIRDQWKRSARVARVILSETASVLASRSPHRRSGGIIPIGNALYMALRQSGTYRDTGRMAKRTNKQPLKLLRSRQEYATALDEIEGYFDKPPKRGTPAANRFDLLELIIDEYEKRHWPIEPPRPIDAIRFQMEMRGRTQADLGRLFGSRQRACELLK